MALYPKAVHKLIAPGSSDPRIVPTMAVVHVDAGNASTLYGWFTNPKANGVESHFHIRRDGVVEQYRDTNYQADAQVGGAAKAVSIETQGYGSGEWTPAQLAALVALLGWLTTVHPGIPRRACTGPYSPGIGYHSMWPSDMAGTWARDGRTCPGPDRIKQFRATILPALSGATTEEDDDMPNPVDLWRWDGIPAPDPNTANPTWQPDSYLRETFRLLRTVRAEVGALRGLVGALAANPGADADAIAAAAKAGAAAALDERIADADVTLEVTKT